MPIILIYYRIPLKRLNFNLKWSKYWNIFITNIVVTKKARNSTWWYYNFYKLFHNLGWSLWEMNDLSCMIPEILIFIWMLPSIQLPGHTCEAYPINYLKNMRCSIHKKCKIDDQCTKCNESKCIFTQERKIWIYNQYILIRLRISNIKFKLVYI